MPRRTFPRSDHHHRVVATEVLDKHVRRTGVPLTLPVPIELIIEDTYGLEIMWDPIDEPPNTTILGALFPQDKRIVLNERHLALFERWVGPERLLSAALDQHQRGWWRR